METPWPTKLILGLLRPFFHLLYHQFAWSYDLVAAAVSLGRWNDWVRCAVPRLGGRVLELGCGPGHLQAALHRKNLPTWGLDESPQMARQASRRLRRKGFVPRLARGRAGALPFPAGTFDSAAATFPSEYIFEPAALAEIRRVLAPGGRLVVIPAAWITGGSLLERMAAWLFRVTGQAGALDAILPAVGARFRAAGFQVRHETVEIPGSRVLVVLADRP